MGKKAVKKKEPEFRLRHGLTWRLSDPGMGLLERAGLSALYMSLRAAEELGKKDALAPLTWNESDLTPDSVTIRSTEDDKTALVKLFEWAWQVRDGVLYLPAVHREKARRDNPHLRIADHNGVCGTFLQHPRVQSKGDVISRLVLLDEEEQILIQHQTLDGHPLKPHSDLKSSDRHKRAFDRDGVLVRQPISLSGWVFPGSAGRYEHEKPWEGTAELAILMMLAPLACLFSQMHNERKTWLVIVPDVRDLDDFDLGRSNVAIHGDLKWNRVASLADAGLRFLSTYQTRHPRRELQTGCRVIAMGKVDYYNKGQSIRKGVVDVPADAQLLRRYRLLDQHLGNRWTRRKAEQKSNADTKAKKKEANSDTLQASGFISVPTVRGRIADNLIMSLPWYANLSTPLQWDMDSLEKQRRRTQGSSIERLWFTNLKYQGRQLVELIQEDDMWDDPNEREFVRAFWETLGALYYREKEAVERGGSRAWGERIEDLNEDIRRDISRAKTGPLLRETLAELFVRPVENYRSPTVRKHPFLIWRLIDKDWKRGRDLALLALASYQSKEKREASNDGQSEHETTED